MANNSTTLPDGWQSLTREDLVAKYLQSYKIRSNSAYSVLPGSPAWIDAQVMADQEIPIHGNCKRAADAIDLENLHGTKLEGRAKALGITPLRIPASGSTGSITITASAGGGMLFAGDQLTNTTTGLRYQVLFTGLYTNGANVAVQGVDTGPATNAKGGTVLTFSNQRPGIGSTATVYTQPSTGLGLSGGTNVETDPQLRDRIRDFLANPPAGGNDAQYQSVIEGVLGLGIQKAFTYPAILGCGTIGIAFTMAPAYSGASRVPSRATIQAVQAALIGQFPADDSQFVCTVTASTVTVEMKVSWTTGSTAWRDATPWPPYDATNPVKISSATDATHFVLSTANSSIASPQVGQSIAVFDAPNMTFRAKTILTVTGAASPWTITCDTTNNGSDTSYTPVAGQLVSPWSGSLQLLVPPVASHFDQLGPGEQVSTPFDPGLRQKRQPESPGLWPSSLTGRFVTDIYALPQILDVQVVSPTLPYACPVGTAGVNSYVLTLGDLAAYVL